MAIEKSNYSALPYELESEQRMQLLETAIVTLRDLGCKCLLAGREVPECCLAGMHMLKLKAKHSQLLFPPIETILHAATLAPRSMLEGNRARSLRDLARQQVFLDPHMDRVLVKQFPAPEQAAGAIVIPDSQKTPPLEGEVMAVGKGRFEYGHLIAPGVSVGDHVLFADYAGVSVTVDGEEYLLMRSEEILATRMSKNRGSAAPAAKSGSSQT